MNINAELVAFRPKLSNMAWKLTKNRDDAEDLVQETYVRALGNLDQFDPATGTDGLRAWVATIMKNFFKSALRKAGRLVFTDDPDYAAKLVTAPNQQATVELREALVHVEALGPRMASAVLHRAVGTHYAEAATVLGCAQGTFKSRSARGIRKLSARYQRSV